LKKPNKKEKAGTHRAIASKFEQERIKALNRAVSIGAILAAILVPVFGLLDLVFKSNIFWTFFYIRAAVTITSILIFFLMKTHIGRNHPFPLGALLTFIVGGSIALMCYLDMGPTDPYYAGINLPLLGFGILLPMRLKEGTFIFVTVWLSYLIPNLSILEESSVGIFISNNFFIFSTIIIALASSQFHLHHRKKQFYTLQRLEVAHRKIKSHAKELENKVQERTQRLLQSERLAVVGQLAGGVAHDFNNFLTAILGTSELLLHSTPENDPTRQDIEGIARVGRQAAGLVKQLLAFSRNQIMVPQNLNLNPVITNFKKMLSRVIGEHIEVEIILDSDLKDILADPIQIEQIILNLCVNARDAMPDGGKLIIETSNTVLDKLYCRRRHMSIPTGEYVMLTISDTGKGMNNEVKSKIFEPFFTTKEEGEGTGLGLSSVYGIVKQNNGDILVYSEEGQGTTFKIYIPFINEPNKKIERIKLKRKSYPRGKETILLVEDEEYVRTLTARMLEKQGYNVIQAREGNEALDLSSKYEGTIDMLLTDVVMPHMNGKILAKHLTQIRTDIKVLYLSGYTGSIIVRQGILESNNAFLQKPYTMESLTHKIRNVFDN
jgi:signal transduction histidine kinase